MRKFEPDALAARLYAAVLDGEGLDGAFADIALALDAMAAVGQRMLLDRDAPRAEPAVIRVNVSTEATQRYARDWVAHDPWIAAERHKPDGVVNLSRLVPPAQIRRQPIWVDFLSREAPLFHGLALRMRQPGGFTALASFWRGEHAEPFDTAQEAVLRSLQPHITRAFRAENGLAVAALRDRTLDALSHGVAIMGPDRRMLFANAALQRMAALDDGLRLTRHGIVLDHPDHQSWLAACIWRAVQAGSGQAGMLRQAGSTIAPGAEGSARWAIDVLPLAPGGSGLFQSWCGAAVMVTDTMAGTGPDAAALRLRFGLTHAEAALALALLRGLSLSQAAVARGVSVNTARTQLARIRAKTGCRRQGELLLRLTVPAP